MVDQRRVAARAVGRTPQEHEALERALARRRARRLERSLQELQHLRRRHAQLQMDLMKWEGEEAEEEQQHSPEHGESAPSYEGPLVQHHDNGRVTFTHHLRTSLSVDTPVDLHRIAMTVHYVYEQELQRVETDGRTTPPIGRRPAPRRHHHHSPAPPRRLDPIHFPYGDVLDLAAPPRGRPYYYNAHESAADALEAAERDDRLIDAREQLRLDPDLSANAKTVLLLVTQIPRGRWTDYATLREHIRRTKTRRELNFLGSSRSGGGDDDYAGIAKALRDCPFDYEAVPCHRVVGEVGGTEEGGVWLGDHRADVDLLEEEGVRFGEDLNPLGEPWSGFRGCPRLEVESEYHDSLGRTFSMGGRIGRQAGAR